MPLPLPDRFLAVLRPAKTATCKQRAGCACRDCKPRPAMDDADFAAALMRMLRAWGVRVTEDPENLATHKVIANYTREISDVAIAINAERYNIDPRLGVSMLGCARIMGVSRSTASEARARGVAHMAARIDRAGAARFSEAKRERQMIEEARTEPATVSEMDAYRARHARAS